MYTLYVLILHVRLTKTDVKEASSQVLTFRNKEQMGFITFFKPMCEIPKAI